MVFFFLEFLRIFHNTVMICNIPAIGVMIQQKVRKKGPVLMLIFSTINQKSQV